MKLFSHRVFIDENQRKKYLFIISLLFSCCIAVTHSLNQYLVYGKDFVEIVANEDSYTINPCLPVYNVYNFWIGCDSKSLISKLYFKIVPFISIAPNIISGILSNRKHHIPSKNMNLTLYFKKYIDSLLFSGLIVIIPLILNFCILLLFFPLTTPDSIYDIYYGVFSGDFLADIYYSHPYLYVLIYLLIDFIICGLFGCLILSFSLLEKFQYSASIIPFGLLLFFEAINNKYHTRFLVEISPLSIMFPATSHNSNLIVISTEISILILFSLILPMARSNEYEA